MARIWTYRSYITLEGVDEVATWFDSLPIRAAVYGRTQLNQNKLRPLELWQEANEYKVLSGELEGLECLRIIVPPKKRKYQPDEVEHYRILGFSDSSRMEFTMVKGFQKADYKIDPYKQHGPLAMKICALCKAKRNIMTVSAEEWLKDD